MDENRACNSDHDQEKDSTSSKESDVSATVAEAEPLSSSESYKLRLLQKEEQFKNNEEASEMLFNKKALPRFELTYKLETFKKNALIIFNQNSSDTKPRRGTHRDVEALTKTFKQFNFEVYTHHDLSSSEILEEMKTFTAQDFSEYGCIGVVVLSHGFRDGELEAATVNEIRTFFRDFQIIDELLTGNKHTLVTKPKFLIVQACRGRAVTTPVTVIEADSGKTDIDAKASRVPAYHLPEEADMLILHSSYDGTLSFRDSIGGSWLIQSLCKTIDRLASTHDLESIITEVKRIVAIERFRLYRETLAANQMMCRMICQMPVVTSTLTRKLYLKKFGDPAPLTDPSLMKVLTFIDDASPWNSLMDDIEVPSVSAFCCFWVIIIIHIFVPLFVSGTFNVHINLSSQ